MLLMFMTVDVEGHRVGRWAAMLVFISIAAMLIRESNHAHRPSLPCKSVDLSNTISITAYM
jgi:hypothetical protein